MVALGIEAVELRSRTELQRGDQRGHYPGQTLKPGVLLATGEDGRPAPGLFARRGLEISALSCNGNPVHTRPSAKKAQLFHRSFEDSVRLAAELAVPCVIVFSGTPGGSPGRTPN